MPLWGARAVRTMGGGEMDVRGDIADWGAPAGPLLVFGGAHSNRQATEALLAEAARRGIAGGGLVFTGDACAYCADPAGTLAALRRSGARMIAGNMERSLSEGAQDCGCGFGDGTACDLLSARWFAHCAAGVDADARAFMGALPDRAVFAHAGRTVAVIHGAARQVNGWVWPDAAEDALMAEVTALEEDLGRRVDRVLAGHSGLAFRRALPGGRDWINAGAIGLPGHDGDARTMFAAIAPDGTATLHRLAYDHAAAAAEMAAAGLPPDYAGALSSGWWPSEDVLPPALRRDAGGPEGEGAGRGAGQDAPA